MEPFTDTLQLVQLPSGHYAALNRTMSYGDVVLALLLVAMLVVQVLVVLRVRR
jgi:hypothetical protein